MRIPLTLALLAALPMGCRDKDHSADTAAPESGAPFRNPVELSPDADGVYDLTFGPAEVNIGGQRFCLRTYNGAIPGPTLRIPAGTDRHVRVNLVNAFRGPDERLVSGQEGLEDETCHDFNLTNLHFHGGHVRPDYAVGGEPCTGSGCGTNPNDGDGLANDYYGDNVLIEVPFGASAQYRWDLDEDHVHHEGLDWFHPHIHGSTAIQVGNGVSGTLIVEGPMDELPSVVDATERVMVVSHIPWDVTENNIDGDPLVRPLADGESCDDSTLSVNNFLALTMGSTPLLNGQLRPVMTTAQGQVERWRILHAGQTDEMFLALFPGNDEGCASFDVRNPIPLTQIAADGIALPQSWERNFLFMSPGYRMEVLVPMPSEESTLCFVAARPTDITVNEDGSPLFPDIGNVLNVVHVSAGTRTGGDMPDPATLNAELATVAPPTSWLGTVNGQENVPVSCDELESGPLSVPQQEVVLLHPLVDPTAPRDEKSTGGSCMGQSGHGHEGEVDPCICPEPNINCRKFDVRRAFTSDEGNVYRNDRVLVAGSTERWDLQAADGHPYHIHINPFLMCPTNTTKEPPFPHWRDTLWVQVDDVIANGFEPVHVLAEYAEAFTGAYVFHCHKLNHEDEGMMEKIEVCAPGDADCMCLDGETDAEGQCVEPASGCYPNDEGCLFAAWAMDGFSPGDLGESPVLPRDMDAEGRNSLHEAGLDECCQLLPDLSSADDLASFFEALTTLDPACCPDLSIPWPPGHPCAP